MQNSEYIVIKRSDILQLRKNAEINKGKAVEVDNTPKYYTNCGTIVMCDFVLNNSYSLESFLKKNIKK